MKKNDIILIVILIIVVGILYKAIPKQKASLAKVFYENQLVLTIDLNKDGEYDVEGYNGNIHIVVQNQKIKVEEENSPKHLCSKQGFIAYSHETIVCLPNRIVITIEGEDLVDTVVG